MTDEVVDDELEDEPVRPPEIDVLPVAGAEGLPDDVRNGDADPDETP